MDQTPKKPIQTACLATAEIEQKAQAPSRTQAKPLGILARMFASLITNFSD
jgi:hypothetical protein